MEIIKVSVPLPPMGGKCFVVERKGMFVLEEGPALLRVIACTHAGAGGLIIHDGVPNTDGYFPEMDLTITHPHYYTRNGRPLFRAHPVIMGSWALDAGALHGLTVVASGGNVDCVATIVWIPTRRKDT